MKLLFDTSVWVEHLRHNALDRIIPGVRGRFVLWFDAVSAAELRAGCRTKRERDVVGRLLSPFEDAGRLAVPNAGDYVRAATALSRRIPFVCERRTGSWSGSSSSAGG